MPDRPNISTEPSGGRLSVQHTERSMRCFNVTEPELDSIGVMNLVSTGAFSFAAAVLGFCVDFKKDVMFAENLGPQAEAINVALNWLGLPFILALVGIGVWAQWKRGAIIEKIKHESSSSNLS